MRKTRIVLAVVVAVILVALLLLIPKGRQLSQSTHYVYLQPEECLTRDNKKVLMSVNLRWQVADAGAFAKNFPDNSITLAQRRLNGMIYSAGAEVVGQHNLSEFVNHDGSKTTLSTIEKTLRTSIEGKLDQNSGIVIESVGINSVKQR